MKPPVETSFEKLAAAVAALNAETDKLGPTIADFERKLSATKVAIELWPDFISSSEPELENETEDGNGDDVRSFVKEGWQFGYAKVGNEWRIAVIPCESRWQGQADDVERHLGFTKTGDPIALAGAPLEIQQLAGCKLEHLVFSLTEEAMRLAAALAKNREAAAKR